MRSEVMNKVKMGIIPKRNVRGIKFFTVKDLAEILNLSITSARLYLKEGKIKGAIKIGGSWYISNKNLDRWLSQSYLFNKSEAKLIENKVIGNIEISLEKIRLKQELLKKRSAPKYLIEKLQLRIDEIKKSLEDYKKEFIKV